MLEQQKQQYQVHVSEVPRSAVRARDGWQDIDIRFVIDRARTGASDLCMFRTVFAPGAAHERHIHPNAAEVVYVTRGRGAAGAGADEREAVAGTAAYVPAGTVHWFRNPDSVEAVEVVGCYAPAGSLEEAGYEYVGPITDEYRSVANSRERR